MSDTFDSPTTPEPFGLLALDKVNTMKIELESFDSPKKGIIN